MSAAAVELIAAAADLEERPQPSRAAGEATRRVAVAVHLDPDRLLPELRARQEAVARTGCDLPEPGLDLERIEREARAARRRESLRRVLALAAGAVPLALRAGRPSSWIAALAALFVIELSFRLARKAHVRRRLGPETFAGVGRGARGDRDTDGRRGSMLVGTPRAPYPGTGWEIDSVVLAADLGRSREGRRVTTTPCLRRLGRETEIAVRRLWLRRLRFDRRTYRESPDGPDRDVLAFELPIGDDGGLLTTLIRYACQGDALLVEARFRFLPPLARDLPADVPLHPRRVVGEIAGDVAASLLRSPFSWLGALGWIGSGVLRPAMAAARPRAGVQERSLRERLAEDEPGETLTTEVAQLAAAIRQRFLDGLAESLVRRGICPGPVRALAARGDVTVAGDPPARAPRPRRRRRAARGRRRPPRR